MKSIVLGNSELVSSRLVYGCMRICGDNSPADKEKGRQAIRTAIEAGYTHFDHADVYGGGACERRHCNHWNWITVLSIGTVYYRLATDRKYHEII